MRMRREDVRQAMHPFRQVSNVMSRKHQGVGLGLPLARRFIELHGGTLALHSEPGQGTRAVLILPKGRVFRREGSCATTSEAPSQAA